MAHSSIDLVKKVFRNVTDLETFSLKNGVNLEDQDDRFVRFLRKFVVAYDTDDKTPSIGEKVDDYSDMIMRFIQSSLRRGSQSNVITIGLETKNENARGFIKSGYDVSVPLLKDQTAFSSFSGSHWRTFHELVGDAFLWFFLKNISLFKRDDKGPLIQVLGKPVFDLLKTRKPEEVYLTPGERHRKFGMKLTCPLTKVDAKTSGVMRKRKITEATGHSGNTAPKRKRQRLEVAKRDAEDAGKGPEVSRKLSKKRTRRGKKKIKSALLKDEEKGESFYYRLPIKQTVFLHAKNHRERIHPAHMLSSCSTHELFNSISKLDVSVYDSGRKDNSRSNLMKKGNVWLIVSQNLPTERRVRDRSAVPERFSPMLELLEAVIRKHRKFVRAAKRIVDYHCPVGGTDQLPAMSTAILLEKYSPLARVHKFVRHALCFVFPLELLGGTRNRNQLVEFFHSILKLQRSEKVCLGMLMDRIHCNEFKWTDHLSSHKRRKLIAQVLLWVIRYCFMLVKSFFYVTMASAWKNRLFFYRKCLWRELHKRGINDIITKGVFKRITKQDAIEMMKNGLAIGYSPLRLFPKTKSLRPIAHLGWKPRVGTLSGQSINQTLSSAYLILREVCQRNPHVLGCGLMALDDFHEKYAQFIQNNRNRKLYYVKADIKDCYDSINRTKLLAVLHQVFQLAKQVYQVKRHVSVCERYQKVTARYHSVLQGETGAFFPKSVKNCRKSSILIEQNVYNPDIEIEETMKSIQRHLLFNVLCAQGMYYHQVQGISQGSVLSSLLCNIYCGSFENEFIQVQENELLVRQVDDYLLVTTDQKSAKKFLEVLSGARCDYNLMINPQKTIVNFKCSDVSLERRPIVTQSLVVRWCGMLIDLASYAVSPDYWRYEGLNFDDCISAEYILHPGYGLQRKLMHCIQIKLTRGYYDVRVHSETSIIKNLFEISIFAARIYISLCGKLTKFHRSVQNHTFLISVVSGIPVKIKQTLRRYSEWKVIPNLREEGKVSPNLREEGKVIPNLREEGNVIPNLREIEYLVYSVFELSLSAQFSRKRLVRGIRGLKNFARKNICKERLPLFMFTRKDIENGPFGQIL